MVNSMGEIMFTKMTPAVRVKDVPKLNKENNLGSGPKQIKLLNVSAIREFLMMPAVNSLMQSSFD